MRLILLFVFLFCAWHIRVCAQVDTTLLFDPNTRFGELDIRLSKGAGHSYYIQEGITFSFRENGGAPTNTYLKMTAWDSSPYTAGNMRERTTSDDLFVMNYRMLKPQRYEPSFEPGYPLVIVMHGMLERGNCAESDCYHADKSFTPNQNVPTAPSAPDHKLLNNDFNLVHAGLDYLEAHDINGTTLPDEPSLPSGAYPGFVLFPQNLNGWDVSASQDLVRLVRLLIKKYNIDPNRVYINGISHGGHGAYEVLKRAPWMFAAAVMFSAADDASVINQKMAGEIATIPLWAFQGALDASPTPQKTEGYIKAFRKAGANVRYTLYQHLGHGTWNEAMDEPDYFSWLLAQKRNNIHVPGGNASLCSTSDRGITLALPRGFKSYEWEREGTLIAGSNQHTFIAISPGTYRARYLMYITGSEHRWSTWSDPLKVEEQTGIPPELEQIGTLLLRDLNGNREAQLRAVGNFPYYFWYKDGKQIKSPAINDTLNTVTFSPELGSGAYSLRVAGYDGCKSPPSEQRQIVFDDKAPITLPSASDLKADALSPSEILLQWTETSERENGFEIWQRLESAGGNFSPWEMRVLTTANTTSFTDRDLSPASVYHYRIRAVNDSERSDYFPENEIAIVVTTPPDTEFPSAPVELTAKQEGVNAIRLNWKPAHDNSGIREYIINYQDDTVHTNLADTTYLVTALKINTDYSFSVQAADAAANVSGPSNVAQANTHMRGLYYQHSTGAWDNLAMIDWSIAEFSGTVNDFTLSPKTQEDFFNFMFDGFLNIEKEGVYQFRLTSDDGSVLSLNDSLLIANDGIHNANTVTSPVQLLDAGPHRINLKYFDYALSDTLVVEYKGPDSNGEWLKIPPEALGSTSITAAGPEAENEFDLKIYPNPVSENKVYVEWHSGLSAPVSIVIRNLSGDVVLENIMEHRAGVAIELPSNISAGLYVVSLRQGVLHVNKKIIIVR